MKNSSKRIFTLIILFVSVLVFSTITASAAVASVPQTYTTADESMEIETKYKKASTNQITFNSNGGKIGTKTKVITNLKKGAKIKLPTTPKRKGYDFKGWYTKKNGGKKISVNAKPIKSVTLYAQWTKKKSTSANSKIVGSWVYFGKEYKSNYNFFTGSTEYGFKDVVKTYYFRENGSFINIKTVGKDPTAIHGKYKVSNGKIYFTNIVYEPGTQYEERLKDRVHEYKLGIGKNTGREYILIPSLEYYGEPYSNIKLGVEYYREKLK